MEVMRKHHGIMEQNGLYLNGVHITHDALEMILTRCDLETVPSIRLVCSEWTNVTRSNSFFKALYDRYGVPWSSVPSHIKSSKFSSILLYLILKKNGFRTNLVWNPSGENDLMYWQTDVDEWNTARCYIKAESPPIGCESLVCLPNSCFVTSYMTSNVWQFVDVGVHDEIINLLTPFEIRFSVKTAARFDCGGEGKFQVEESGNFLPGGTEQFVKVINLRMKAGETHWVEHKCAAYFASGKRYVCPRFYITFGAKDTNFWAGHYGLKFAHISASLKLLSPEEAEEGEEKNSRTEVLPIS